MLIEFFTKIFSKITFLTGFISGKNSYPSPLSKEEEIEMVHRMQNGDKDARDKLIKHNLRLVAHIAKKYIGSNDMDDLISIGCIGLIKGVESYQIDKSTTLATFLVKCIENEILMTLRSGKKYKNTVYLNDSMGVDNDGNEFSLMDILAIKEDSVFRKVEQNVLAEKMDELLRNELTEREYIVITYRFGLRGAPVLTQLQTAKMLGISRSYISRIETKALNKLYNVMSTEDVMG